MLAVCKISLLIDAAAAPSYNWHAKRSAAPCGDVRRLVSTLKSGQTPRWTRLCDRLQSRIRMRPLAGAPGAPSLHQRRPIGGAGDGPSAGQMGVAGAGVLSQHSLV